MEAFQIPWPFWRMQYQLLGGHRRMLLICGGYLVLLVVTSVTIRRLSWEEPLAAVVDWLIYGLGVVQSIIVFAGGCSAVHRATLRDHQTRMNESHRLTPVSSVGMVLGYLFGPTALIVLLWLVGVLFGAILEFFKVPNVTGWLLGNVQLLAGAIMLWAMVVLMGMGQSKPVNPNAILLVAGSLAVPASFGLPGAALFFGAFSAYLGYWLATGSLSVPKSAVTLSILGNILITGFWIYVAAAKFRRPDLPAFNGFRGMVLLTFWLVIGFGSCGAFQYFTRTAFPGFSDESALPIQWITTLIASLVVAAFPIAGAVHSRRLLREGTAGRDWTDRISDEAVLLMVTVLILGIAFLGALIYVLNIVQVTGNTDLLDLFEMRTPWLWTAAVVVLANVTLWSAVRLAFAWLKRPVVYIGVFLLLIWAVPPLLDLALAGTVRAWTVDPVLTALFAASPAGAIIAIWERFDLSVPRGVAMQLIVAVGMAGAAIRGTRSRLSVRSRSIPPATEIPLDAGK
jgi:hypothetical protein